MKPTNSVSKLSFAVLAALVALGTASVPASAQDAAKGEKVFKKCRSCHAVGEDAKNKTGPELNGVVGREAASIDGFKYSKALSEAGLTWDEETLATFLAKPKALVKGTKMSFPGLKKDSEIADVIAYLETFNPDGTAK